MSPRRILEMAKRLPSWHFERLLWMHKAADIAAPWRGWCMNSEAILLFSRPKAIWPKPSDYRTDVYRVGPWERTGHPNGKPLEVVTDLCRRLCVSTVLDPFLGSGTTLVAAKQLGRRAIGIEIEERYCEIAARRLSQDVLPLEVTA
jgi:site-specific DNA-methyltransferase (adenine-specific)